MTLVAHDARPRKRDGGVAYREAWAFKGTTEDWLRNQLTEMPHPIVHVCSGASRLGDIRVDIVHPGADIRADGRHLPFRDGSIGTVLMDPPWKLEAAERQRLISAAGRALRRGGALLLYAPWWPSPLWADLEVAYVRVNGKHQLPLAPVIFSRWRKRADANRARFEDEQEKRGRKEERATNPGGPIP